LKLSFKALTKIKQSLYLKELVEIFKPLPTLLPFSLIQRAKAKGVKYLPIHSGTHLIWFSYHKSCIQLKLV